MDYLENDENTEKEIHLINELYNRDKEIYKSKETISLLKKELNVIKNKFDEENKIRKYLDIELTEIKIKLNESNKKFDNENLLDEMNKNSKEINNI